MSSSSSTPGNDKKSRLTSEILKQYNKDVLYMDVLKQSFESLDESIKKRDKLSKKLLQLPPTAIRDLVILFMIDEDATDVQQLHLIADIIQKLRCSMKLKVDFLDAYMTCAPVMSSLSTSMATSRSFSHPAYCLFTL
ncbi:hypothetical protein E3N88_06572 [Mikania micrantha]|uniref:Uncharacterized protein n=2 Tax=Mikania micrantha TaxID=192012 RepID=A0A5N6PQC9_9ASTR|nr:hypothetical protein E3N88_33041 [Mikania micrantha]KAD6795676.1 hypothetical protein E3N88_06572 [Mikania micrantha]